MPRQSLDPVADAGAHPTALDVSALVHRYGDREALRSVSFTVGAGESFGLLGPNGSGKTTLFNVASTLLAPTDGTIRVFGHDVSTHARHVRRRIGVMFQSPALDPRLRVDENLRHHGRLYGLVGQRLTNRIRDMLELVRLDDRATDLVGTLSGGLQRRVELAKALLPAPWLLLLDEPSTGLDLGARREVWDHLRRLRDTEGTTIVVATHLMDEAARCDRVGILHEGRLVALGTPESLVAEIGADVILVASPDLRTLADKIQSRFGQRVGVVDGLLRLERQRGTSSSRRSSRPFPVRSMRSRSANPHSRTCSCITPDRG